MEIFRHNLIEPGVFRKLASLPEALTSSILDPEVLIRMNTKEPRRVTGPCG